MQTKAGLMEIEITLSLSKNISPLLFEFLMPLYRVALDNCILVAGSPSNLSLSASLEATLSLSQGKGDISKMSISL